MFIVYSYFVYLAISLTVTVWVARTLHSRGRIFLVDAFQGHVDLADSVNHLLVVGFYLINVGCVVYALKTYENPANLRQAIEVVSDKLGLVLLVLGLMHFFNLYVFSRVRRRAQENNAPPPFAADALLTSAGRPQEG
jgi:predicted MFS family arabinose efflux permease